MIRAIKGFTLIELLIVVAIIAILAAIAVPNFLEAQTRAKVSRVKADCRTQVTAIEAYTVDWNTLPRDNEGALDQTNGGLADYTDYANGVAQLTTPIAYMTSILTDPFSPVDNSVGAGSSQGYRIGSGTWSYATAPTKDVQDAVNTFNHYGKVMAYIVFSPGPDRNRCRNSYKCFPYKPLDGGASDAKPGLPSFYEDYDPTNGTVSGGDVMRVGGSYLNGNWDRNATGAGPRGPDQN